MNSTVKIFGVRMSLIGDCVMALPILDYLKEKHKDSYVYFSLAQKCKQALFLFKDDPRIDEVKITDNYESLGEEDMKIADSCDIFINPKPQHPKEFDWYNYRSCVEETFIMAGLDLKDLKTKPALFLGKPLQKHKKTISIWPVAGYGKGLNRSPSKEWWEGLLSRFEGIDVYQFGASDDFILNLPNVKRFNNMSFEDQIINSLKCSVILGTDSGSMWVTGAYGLIPQINLITNWQINHNSNFLALAPEGEKCVNIFANGSCNNIDQDIVAEKITNILYHEKL